MMTRTSYLFLVLCLFGLLCLPATGAELSASPSGGVSMAVGDDTAVSLAFIGADSGISGFNITLAVSDPAVVSIAGVSFADWVMLPVNSTPDRHEVFVTGVDLNQQVQPGSETFPLFTIRLKGHIAGLATLTITPRRIEDDLGGRYVSAPLQIPIQVGTVTSSPTPIPTATASLPASTAGSGTGASSQPASPTHEPFVTPTAAVTHVLPEGTGLPVQTEETGLPVHTTPERTSNTTTPIATPAPSTPLSWVLPIASLAGLAGLRAWRMKTEEANQ